MNAEEPEISISDPYEDLPKRTRALVIDAINRSFRDTADRDYIAARCLHRIGLDQQFLWSALQAVEKYLKAILLYSRIDTRDLYHDLDKALRRVNKKAPLQVDLMPGTPLFIERLNGLGHDRYFERPFSTEGNELLNLDWTVWDIRRYCQFLGPSTFEAPSGEIKDWSILARRTITEARRRPPTRFSLSGGYLERVLGERDSAARATLVWKNPCFGTRSRKTMRRYRIRMHSGNPTTFMHPETFGILKSLAKFSPEVHEFFADKSRKAG